MEASYTYRAFISYSQTDKKIARQLQSWLEHFKAPSALNGARIGKIFRDETHLAGAPDLGDALKKNIDASEALIVLCSPAAAKSEWVEREIQHFRATSRAGQIFAVILSGEPNARDPSSECFPKSFRKLQGSEHSPQIPAEPLAVNLVADGRDRAFARLAAGLLSLPFDAVWQREQRRQRVVTSLFAGAAVLFMALAVAAGFGFVLADQNARSAEANAARAKSALGRIFAERAWEALGQHRYRDAARYAVAGWKAAPEHEALFREALSVVVLEGGQGRPLSGHSKRITDIAFDPTRTRLVSISEDGKALLWDLTTGKTVATIGEFTGTPKQTEFASTGEAFFTVDDVSIKLWTPDGLPKATIKPAGRVDYATFDPAAERIATCSLAPADPDPDQKPPPGSDEAPLLFDVTIWEVATAKQLIKIPDSDCRSVAFSPNGRLIATVGFERNALWDARTGKEAHPLEAVELDDIAFSLLLQSMEWPNTFGAPRPPSFNHDGSLLVTTHGDGIARVWDVETGKLHSPMFVRAGQGFLTSATFGRDANIVVTTSLDGTVRVFDVDQGTLVFERNTSNQGILGAALSPAGEYVAAWTPDGVDVWSTRSGEHVYSRVEQGSQLSAMAASPTGLEFATGSESGSLALYAEIIGEYVPRLAPEKGAMRAVTFDPTGTLVAAAPDTSDGLVEIWHPDSGQTHEFQAHDHVVNSVHFSGDGSRLVTSGLDYTARVWDARTWQSLLVLEHEESKVDVAQFSPAGDIVITSAHTDHDSGVYVWDAKTGRLLREIGDDLRTDRMSFSSDGRLLALETAFYPTESETAKTGEEIQKVVDQTEYGVEIWDLVSGQSIANIRGHSKYLTSVAFGPSDELLTTSSDGSLKLWRKSQDKVWTETLRVEVVSNGSVEAGALSSDGKLIATAATGGLIQIRDARTGRLLLTRTAENGRPRSMAFSPTNSQLVVGGGSGGLNTAATSGGVVSVWPIDGLSSDIEALAIQACSRILPKSEGQSLFPPELRQRDPLIDDVWLADGRTERSDPCDGVIEEPWKLGRPFADMLARHADALYDAASWEDAAAAYTRVLEAAPGHPDRLYLRASAYGEANKLDEALVDLNNALRVMPHDPDILNLRCWNLAVVGVELARAKEDCDASIALAPQANTFDSRGFVFLKMGDFASAYRDYETAVNGDDTLASAWFGRGLAQIRLGQEAAGLADLERGRQLDPTVAELFESLGRIP